MAKLIELWPVEKLIPYERNARTHSPEQVAQIAASIQEFGFTNPILVASDAGIIAGHGRLAAARQLGMDQVPVIVLDHLTPEQRRAYVLADNQLALNAGWDVDLLRLELTSLQDLSFDLDVIGFSDQQIAGIMEEPNFEPATEDDQSRLDEKNREEINCTCPNCGHEFIQQI